MIDLRHAPPPRPWAFVGLALLTFTAMGFAGFMLADAYARSGL